MQLSVATSPPPAATRFTTVEEDADREYELRKGQREPLISATTIMLVVALAAIAGAIWYALQPESANSLFGRIEAAAATNDDHRLMEAQDDVTRFLSLYPGDPHADEVRSYQARIHLAHAEGTALMDARRLQRRYPNSPLGRMYLEATRQAEIDPARASVQLKAMVDMYDDGERHPADIRDFVEAARQQLLTLKQRVRSLARDQTALVVERLRHAEQIHAKDPQQARRIRQAIIALYQDDPWAAELVAQARAALGEQTLEEAGR